MPAGFIAWIAVLVIILATLLLGITATLVATRYCKSKSGRVFLVPEVVPSWEKTIVVPPPMPPMLPPPPPCICSTVVCPPQLPVMRCINAQRLARPSGPWPRWQRRNPRKVQSTSTASRVPNLSSLPLRHGRIGEAKMLPVPLPKQRPARVLVKMPSRMPLTQLVPPAKKMKHSRPSQPKPTKSAEGLNTPPVLHDPIRYPLPCKPLRYNFAPSCKIQGKPSKESVVLMPLPSLVPIIQVIYRRGHAPVVLIATFDPSAPRTGRLQVEPCGGLKILPTQGKVRLPRKTEAGNGLQLPAANHIVAFTYASTPKLKRPVGPWPPWQRRKPPRTLRFRRLPDLRGLPPRRSSNVTPHARMPTPLPKTQPDFVKMPSRMLLTQLLPPTRNPKPSQPKPTKSAEGLNTPPAPHQQVKLPRKPHWYNFAPTGKIGGTPNTAPIILLVVPHLVTVIEFTRCAHVMVSVATQGFCAQPGRLQVEPYGFKIEQLQGKPRVPAETSGPGVWQLPAANPPQRIKKPSPHPRRRGQSGYLTSTLGGPWWKKGPKPPVVETSDAPERYYAPFYMERVDVPIDDVPEGREGSRDPSKSRQGSKSPGHFASSREPTPGPGHYNPENLSIRGRIPGRVPGISKIRRDENIRL